MFATLAHAIWVCGKPNLSYELSWDGSNYNRQDSMGTRGTLTFLPTTVIGAFRDDNSPRTPWRSKHGYDLDTYFRGMPQHLVTVAQHQTLQYLLDEYDGMQTPIITAIFWSEGEYLAAGERWTEVVAHGAHLIHNELAEIEESIQLWQEEYEFTHSQMGLLRSLFDQKKRSKDALMKLTQVEYRILVEKGAAGVNESRKLLAAANIIV